LHSLLEVTVRTCHNPLWTFFLSFMSISVNGSWLVISSVDYIFYSDRYILCCVDSCPDVLGNRCPLCRTVLFISPRTCSIRWVVYSLYNALILYGNYMKALGYFIFLVVYSGIFSHCYNYNRLKASQTHGSRKLLNEIETMFAPNFIGQKKMRDLNTILVISEGLWYL